MPNVRWFIFVLYLCLYWLALQYQVMEDYWNSGPLPTGGLIFDLTKYAICSGFFVQLWRWRKVFKKEYKFVWPIRELGLIAFLAFLPINYAIESYDNYCHAEERVIPEKELFLRYFIRSYNANHDEDISLEGVDEMLKNGETSYEISQARHSIFGEWRYYITYVGYDGRDIAFKADRCGDMVSDVWKGG